MSKKRFQSRSLDFLLEDLASVVVVRRALNLNPRATISELRPIVLGLLDADGATKTIRDRTTELLQNLEQRQKSGVEHVH